MYLPWFCVVFFKASFPKEKINHFTISEMAHQAKACAADKPALDPWAPHGRKRTEDTGCGMWSSQLHWAPCPPPHTPNTHTHRGRGRWEREGENHTYSTYTQQITINSNKNRCIGKSQTTREMPPKVSK